MDMEAFKKQLAAEHEVKQQTVEAAEKKQELEETEKSKALEASEREAPEKADVEKSAPEQPTQEAPTEEREIYAEDQIVDAIDNPGVFDMVSAQIAGAAIDKAGDMYNERQAATPEPQQPAQEAPEQQLDEPEI